MVEAPAQASPPPTLVDDLRRSLGVLEKAVAAKELRLLARVLRGTGHIRNRLTVPLIERFMRAYVPESYAHRALLVEALATVPVVPEGDMEVDGKMDAKKGSVLVTTPSSVPEVASYLHLLVVLVLIDAKCIEQAVRVARALVESMAACNRRTMDELSARAFFYYARAMELAGGLSSIRAMLLASYRTATLRHDSASQAVLLNLLLRNYVACNLYDQADKLLSRAPFPETRSNNQLARHLYYTGRIKAIQLDYSEALWNLQQAMRKAPQNSALGFRTSVQKFMIIVQLLTGEIPERSVFRQSQMQSELRPYLTITQAVRVGDMAKFKKVSEECAEVFSADQTTSLILRLRHNVIKTGLRKLSASYSRISLAEICSRLDLDSEENAEGVVAKAIHDAVIDAVIDHDGRFVKSNETIDVYSTTEPTDAYHSRVQFCLNIRNEAVRAMRFPDTREDEETPEQRRERLKEQEELVKTLAEEEDDDDYE